jgi:hypothetical protein
MENNYYTPELSDLHIGYECEVKVGEGWEKTNLTDSIQFPHVELRLSQGRLRTPYLTKEQIEAEGWKFLHMSQDLWFEKKGDFDFDNFYTSKLTMHYGAKSHIGYSDLRLTIIADDRGLAYKLFEGMCPSINEFRKITKLLRITG